MKTKTVRSTIALAALLVLASPLTVLAQQKPDQMVQLYKQLAEQYKAQSEECKTTNAELTKLNNNLLQDKADLQEKIKASEAKLAEKDKQLSLMEQNDKDLRASIELLKQMIAVYEQGNKDRDEVIKELAKGNKRSTLEKIAESLPSIAGIIALALVHK